MFQDLWILSRAYTEWFVIHSNAYTDSFPMFTGCHRFDQSVISVLLANVYIYDPSLYIDYTVFIYRVS